MIKEETLNNLEDLLDVLIKAEGTWREKRDQIEEQLSEAGYTSLEEFVGWFVDE